MALYVVAYPRFSEADRQWVESLRQRHDPQAHLIGAHVTLVFAARNVAQEAAADTLRQVAGGRRAFDLRFTEAVVHRAADRSYYAYLLPDAGADRLRDLHRRLHRKVFTADPAIPFEPHVTLGRSTERIEMDAVVAEMQCKTRSLAARVGALHLIEVENGIAREQLCVKLAA